MLERLKQLWTGMTSRQRAFAAAGGAITVALIVVFVRLIGTPDFKPLLSGVDPADTPAMTAQLAAKNIPFQVSPDGGTISVAADKIDEARLEVASHDTPHSGRLGFEIFDKVSWGQTEFDEKVNYQRALEGELERTIQSISNVKAARVHIVMASDSVFLDRERSAKASVLLRLKSGNLSRDDLSSISRLVAGAVDNLKPTDVAIVDADSNQPLGRELESDSGAAVEQDLTRRLVATLAPVLGEDHIRASVNVELEPGTTEESSEKYDPAVSVPLTRQVTEDQVGSGTGSGGVPGTASNVPVAKPPSSAAAKGAPTAAALIAVPPVKDNGEMAKTESATYGVNKTVMRDSEPAGRIKRITAAVLVDDVIDRKLEHNKWTETRRKRSPEDLKQISDLATAAIGLDSERGDAINVQDMSFQEPDPVELPKITAVEKVRKGLSDYANIVRYAALLLLFVLAYFLMVRPVQKRALSPGGMLLADRRTAETPAMAGSSPAPGPLVAPAVQKTIALKRQLADIVKSDPASSTNAVRSWMAEDAQ